MDWSRLACFNSSGSKVHHILDWGIFKNRDLGNCVLRSSSSSLRCAAVVRPVRCPPADLSPALPSSASVWAPTPAASASVTSYTTLANFAVMLVRCPPADLSHPCPCYSACVLKICEYSSFKTTAEADKLSAMWYFQIVSCPGGRVWRQFIEMEVSWHLVSPRSQHHHGVPPTLCGCSR